MTFGAIETSVDQGSPVELYDFIYSGQAFHLTSADTPVVANNNTYLPAAITRDAIDPTSAVEKTDLKINLARDNPVAQIFATGAPSEVVLITIWGLHLTDTAAQAIVCWQGRIIDCEWAEGDAVLTTENVFSSLQRPGLGPSYTLLCRVPLYSNQCGIVKSAQAITATVTAISGMTLTLGFSAAYADAWFEGGVLTYANSNFGNTESRGIRSSVGAANTVTLANAPIALSVGATVTVYPGCDHSTPTCQGKFNNIANFRGFPYIPTVTPFGGTPIY